MTGRTCIPLAHSVKDTGVHNLCVGFPNGSDGKESTCNIEDLGSIPGFGRSPGEGKGYLLQYSGLENSMDWGLEESDTTATFTFPVMKCHGNMMDTC